MYVVGVSVLFQAEDGIRDPEMSRGLGHVYKRQCQDVDALVLDRTEPRSVSSHNLRNVASCTDNTLLPTGACLNGRKAPEPVRMLIASTCITCCLLTQSDSAAITPGVDLGGSRFRKQNKKMQQNSNAII